MQIGDRFLWRLVTPHSSADEAVEAVLRLDRARLSYGPYVFDFRKRRSEGGELVLTLTPDGGTVPVRRPLLIGHEKHPHDKAGPMDYQDGFEIETQRPADQVIILAVKGEIDVCTSLGLMEAIIEAFAKHPEVIAVDLSELRYMDSAGLGALLQSARHIEDGGVRFAVILPLDRQLMQHPQLIGVHRSLSVYESREEALGPWLDEAGEFPAGA